MRATRAMVEAWHSDKKAEVVFDKGRFWNAQPLALNQVFPEAHMFVCVRDLRDVFASIEKQHAKNPLLDEANSALELTTFNRADRMFSPEGLIGQQIVGIEDLGRRQLPFVHFIQFESLVSNPERILDSIYNAIDEKRFAHDLADVKGTASDVDGLYLGKFPHEGSGEVKPPEGSWKDHVPADIAGHIMDRFPAFNSAFGYQRGA